MEASPGAASATSDRRLPSRRWLAAGALVIAAVAVLAVLLDGSGSPKRASADIGVPIGDTTATVTRRTLSEGSTVDGTLGYGSKLELYDRLSGTFTWLPAVGAVIARGATLFRLDDLRVVLMYGSVPAYRALKRGVRDGPDVAELNANLIDLGFDPYGAITDDESFGEATAAAVRRWQKAEGLHETGEVELGRIVFASGARRVTEVHVSLGQDPPGEDPAATTPTATAPAASTPAATTPTAITPAAPAPSHKSPSHKSKSPAHKSRSHVPSKGKDASKPSAVEPAKEASKSPAKESSEKPGGSSGAGEAVLATTSTQQIVTLAVKAEQQQLARVGETVPVTLPGGNVVHGRISQVGTVASEPKGGSGEEKGSPSDESSESATISVTVTLDHPVSHLDQAPVSVELVRSVRRNVLTVPATALIATAAGGYAVEALEGGRRVTLPVTPGMFAGGYVEVEGGGVHEGLAVIETR